MKKILLVGLTSLLLSSCQIFDLGQLGNSSKGNRTSSSSKIEGSYNEEGLKGSEYLEYYSDVIRCEYFPTSGNPKMLVVPMLFKDTKDTDLIKDQGEILSDIKKVFSGTSEETGWESVSSYYQKTSYGKLNIEMDVYDDWVVIDKTFDEFASLTGYYDQTWYAVDSVVEYLKNQGIDLTQYDSDQDGFIDGIWIVYGKRNYHNLSNPSSTEKDLLWAYTYWESANQPVVGNPKANAYCWASYDFMYDIYDSRSPMKLQPHTFIHETGHILGLEDYYDYDDNSRLNPTGCLDMMDYNIGDHNAFSKYLLGWIEPQVFNFEEGQYVLEPFESSGDFLIIPSSLNNYLTPLDEYLLIEYYTPTGLNELDSKYKLSNGHPLMFTQKGIKIYHVDARLGEFVYSQGDWYFNDYIYNYSSIDLYANTKGNNYYSIFASNTSSMSYEENYKLLRLVSEFYGNDYIYDGKYATNKDLFQVGEVLEGFKFNSGLTFDFDIEVDYLGDKAKIYIS